MWSVFPTGLENVHEIADRLRHPFALARSGAGSRAATVGRSPEAQQLHLSARPEAGGHALRRSGPPDGQRLRRGDVAGRLMPQAVYRLWGGVSDQAARGRPTAMDAEGSSRLRWAERGPPILQPASSRPGWGVLWDDLPGRIERRGRGVQADAARRSRSAMDRDGHPPLRRSQRGGYGPAPEQPWASTARWRRGP